MRRISSLILLILAVVSTGVAAAQADSVRITAPAEVPVESEYSIEVVVDTVHDGGELVAERRPVADGECGATELEDPSTGEQVNLTYYPIPVTASGTFEVTDRFAYPGEYRICAWLRQDLLRTYATAPGVVVRAAALRASVRIGKVSQRGATALGTFIVAEVSGTAEARTRLAAQVVPARVPCPATAQVGPGALPMLGDRGRHVGPGAFELRLQSRGRVAHGAWRVCVAIREAEASTRASARADRTIETVLAPSHSLRGRPRAQLTGDGGLKCRKGEWVGRPRPRFGVSWQFALGASDRWRRIPGANSWRLLARKRGDYRCVVTAVNRAGRSRETSTAVYVEHPGSRPVRHRHSPREHKSDPTIDYVGRHDPTPHWPMKTAVVGHVEWAEFAQVERVPDPGDIVHASDFFSLPAGGAAVAAVQIARLGGGCLFMTATGNDARADLVVSGLRERGLRVEAARRETAQRRAFVFLDADGERTITTIGERVGPEVGDPLPWADLKDVDAVYLTAGNADTVRAVRAAKFVVASVRTGEALAEAGVQVDVLVASANDLGEVYVRGDIDPAPRWVVRTDGARGGTLETAEGVITNWTSNPPSAAKVDSYGAGDTFAGGITYGLGRGFPIETAIAFGAFCGASSVRGRGPYAGHVTPEELAEWERATGVA